MDLLTNYLTEFQESPLNLLTFYALLLFTGYRVYAHAAKCNISSFMYHGILPLFLVLGLTPSSYSHNTLRWLVVCLKQCYPVIIAPYGPHISRVILNLIYPVVASIHNGLVEGLNLSCQLFDKTQSLSFVVGFTGGIIGGMLAVWLVGLQDAAKYPVLISVPYW